jgi:hypothetical protein
MHENGQARHRFPIRSIEPRVQEELANEMYLIEILLPVRDNEGRPFAAKTYQACATSSPSTMAA